MNHYPHHIGDYISATAHLSMLEDGAYRRLLDLYYRRELPLPAAVPAVCRLVRAASDDERAAVEAVLSEFFDLTAEGWRHRRCDAEIAAYQEKSNKAARSAQARWGASDAQTARRQGAVQDEGDGAVPSNCAGSADAMRTHSERNANQEPIASNQEPEVKSESRKRATPRKTPLPDGFAVSEAVQAWADREGFDRINEHLAAFVGKARAAGYRYVDWDQAFMNAIREDWGKVRERHRTRAGPSRPATRDESRSATFRAMFPSLTDERLDPDRTIDAAA